MPGNGRHPILNPAPRVYAQQSRLPPPVVGRGRIPSFVPWHFCLLMFLLKNNPTLQIPLNPNIWLIFYSIHEIDIWEIDKPLCYLSRHLTLAVFCSLPLPWCLHITNQEEGQVRWLKVAATPDLCCAWVEIFQKAATQSRVSLLCPTHIGPGAKKFMQKGCTIQFFII